jgi:hypothetical protein
MRTPKISNLSALDGAIDIERPITVTIATARKISGLGATTLWARIADGTLESVKVGRRRPINYESLVRLLTSTCHTGPMKDRRQGRPRKVGKAVAP